MAKGESPFWAPQFFCGHFLHGDGLVGMLHPLHLILYRAFDLTFAFNAEFLSSYLLLFIGMVWLLRRLETPPPAAMLAATTFTFVGFNALHFAHMNAVAIIAHIPWLLALEDLLLRAKNRSQFAAAYVGIALVTASQWLLGYPQYVLFSLIAEAAFVCWASWGRADARGPIAWLAAKSIGTGAGLVQLLPTFDALLHSVRSAPTMDFRLSYSLHPMNLLQLWSPLSLRGHIYGDNAQELGLYCGSFGTVSLAWPWIARSRALAQRARLQRACVFFAGAMLLLAFGRYGGIYAWLARIPPYSLFRVPARHIVLVHLAMAVLAAAVFADLADIASRRQALAWSSLWPLAIVPALAMGTALIGLGALTSPGSAFSTMGRIAGGTALVCAAAAFTGFAARGHRWALFLLLLLAPADAWMWGMDYLRRSPTQTLDALRAEFRGPASDVQGRLALPDTIWGNGFVMNGYKLTGGYVALPPSRSMDPLSPEYLRLAGARWELVKGVWKPLGDPLPRARIEAGKGEAAVVSDRPGRVELETIGAGPRRLVLSESYYDGWRAVADGRPIPVLRAEGDFIACDLPAGARHVELEFDPWSLRWGFRASIIALLALAGSAAWLLRPSTRRA